MSITDGPVPRDLPSQAPPVVRSPAPPRPVAALLLWTAAAGLAAYAPFTTVSKTLGVLPADGWGRYDVPDLPDSYSIGLGDVHAERFGIGFLAAATMLALLVLAWTRPGWPAAPARVLAVAAPTLLAGVLLAVALELDVQAGQLRAVTGGAAAAVDPELGATLPSRSLDIGPCLWIGVAALVAAVIGSALFGAHQVRTARNALR